ncbi:IclR family transcriptional regulator [Mesorhizobium sp. BAC0120]|uniref:IclR family transcriptional regulator n=1 Tax=Mesorhizobium sp. BAC0120 TaxID=3090670 RepID=UPI00298CA2D6|nr:IclR family transcriptional regulator [Mesorhizobium sp. BAC0120]MDW6024589.1 IclR family transcriptional regulator [Mesorhizobium sp. BAC0120]
MAKTRVARGPRERGIDRVLKLFSFLQANGGPARLAELPQALAAPKSTIYDLVNILVESGLLELRGKDGQVYFGKLMHLYGASYLRANDIMARGREMVDGLAKETGETSEFCTRLRGKQVIVHARPGSRPLRISSEIGSQIPIPWTASGRLMLSHMSLAEIDAILDPEDRRMPNGAPVDLDAFVAECHACRDRPIARTIGTINSFTQCLAAPIINHSGSVEATICFVLPIDIPEEKKNDLEARLIEASKTLSLAGLKDPSEAG